MISRHILFVALILVMFAFIGVASGFVTWCIVPFIHVPQKELLIIRHETYKEIWLIEDGKIVKFIGNDYGSVSDEP